ncbi:GntR family transcriptional regulator [Marinococcus halophilus]|uniref:GntR family transcriptional regulator n=1 Tax=Marinococcus halophilus TaxID=1371 RepID=A0A510Y6T6_MARHA|nr:GntR family transcriptional regulator [Marinococcus halophilus]OZT79718.1 GntR family transcriptional regulator [Marinococcus halophilus]GEK59074.1 GntR family transcriptional regulator [Marinococcus halophilus]
MPHPSIDQSKPESLYLQVKNVLVDRIDRHIWQENNLIPTEQELMKEFDVSRTTIRQAISILVQTGLLERRQGKGTIVKPQKLVGSLGRLKGFAEEVIEKGQTPSSRLIRAEFRDDLYHEKSMLKAGSEEEILLLERIRFADEIPVALERTCWPKDLGELLMNEDLNQAKYYEILEKHSIYLKKANESIIAINATIDEADLLGIRAGEALLKMTRLSFGIHDRPIEYTKTRYRSDQYHYDIDLER